MTKDRRPTPEEIRSFRAENQGLRERDLAARLGISEAALVAAEIGFGATRIDADPLKLLERASGLGEVMVLSRNESAVHEKIGIYEKISMGRQAAMVLGENIDLRIFPSRWTHGFAVSKRQNGEERLSLQYFDESGTAVHKVHMRPGSDLVAYRALVEALALDDQSQVLAETQVAASGTEGEADVSREELRDNWLSLTDTHQFFGMLQRLKIGRQTAIRQVGEDLAWQLAPSATLDMLRASATDGLPIMCFVANSGIVQIHSGPVVNVQTMGPWVNIMDPTFHLHLRQDQIAETWAVRKPTKDGHVTSLEAYDATGDLIIQFFGKRQEGVAERAAWRGIVEGLPRSGQEVAA